MAPTNTLKRKESLVSTHEAPAPLAKGKMLARRETATYHEYAPSEKGSRHTITPLFEAKHRAFKSNFFSRNPELWPVFANEDALEVIGFYVNAPKPDMEASDLPNGVARREELINGPIPEEMVTTEGIKQMRSDINFATKLSKNWYTPLSNENVMSQPSDPSVHGMYMCMLSNPNMVHYEYAKMAADLEDTVAQMIGRQVGYDPTRVAGIFTSGEQDYRFIHSISGHYSNVTALSTLGTDIQGKSISIKALKDNTVDWDNLERQLDDCFRLNIKVPCILLTIGTTDTFGVDDPKKAYDIRDKMIRKYGLKDDWIPHLHCDAAVGWPMMFFNNYNLEKNPIGLNVKTLEVIAQHREMFRNLKYADSITCDFHKWGYCPFSCSMFLVKEKKDLNFMSNDPENFSYFNADPQGHTQFHSTIECSRPGVGVFGAFASLRALGVEGHQIALGHGIQNANYFRHRLHTVFHNVITVGDHNGGPSVCWRMYKGMNNHDETETAFEHDLNMKFLDSTDVLDEHTVFHRQIHDEIQAMHTKNREAGLSLDWIGHMLTTTYDDRGRTIYIPGQKAVFFNVHTTYENIDTYVALLKRLNDKYDGPMDTRFSKKSKQ